MIEVVWLSVTLLSAFVMRRSSPSFVHCFEQSFYFTGPDGEYLEMAAQTARQFTPEGDILHAPKTVFDLV